MQALTREDFLAATGRKVVAVTLPDGAGLAHVRGMTGEEKDAWEAEQMALSRAGSKVGDPDRDLRNFRGRFLSRVVCDASGVLLFKPGDADALGQCSARVLDLLWEVAHPMSGVTAADVKALLGNFVTAPSGGSGSDSH
jgi:hypothetical protein